MKITIKSPPIETKSSFLGPKKQTTAIRGQRTWSPPPRCRLRLWHWYRRRTRILRPWGRASRSHRRRWRRKRQRVSGGRWQEKCWKCRAFDEIVWFFLLSTTWVSYGFDQPNCVFLLMNLTDVCYQKLGNTLNVQTLLAISWWCLPTKIGFSHVFPIFPGEEF